MFLSENKDILKSAQNIKERERERERKLGAKKQIKKFVLVSVKAFPALSAINLSALTLPNK